MSCGVWHLEKSLINLVSLIVILGQKVAPKEEIRHHMPCPRNHGLSANDLQRISRNSALLSTSWRGLIRLTLSDDSVQPTQPHPQ